MTRPATGFLTKTAVESTKKYIHPPYFCLHADVGEGLDSRLGLVLVQQVLGAVQHADHLLQLRLLLTRNHLDSLRGVSMHQSGPGKWVRTLSVNNNEGSVTLIMRSQAHILFDEGGREESSQTCSPLIRIYNSFTNT